MQEYGGNETAAINEENNLMKKQYDYLLVGSGLFAGVFAYYAKSRKDLPRS